MKSKTIIIIVGPTAVGKTSLAIDIAGHFNTAIISADSRQCYRELTIGVAKPDAEQLRQIRHYFINSHSIHEDLNAALFEQYALDAVNEIFTSRDTAVMVGGTGLYIKAFCEGLDQIPAVSPEVRESITASYKRSGINWLQEQLRVIDPDYIVSGEILNPQRLMRALEVKLHTGRSIREFQQHKKVHREFKIIKIGLELPKEELHKNIHWRVDEMMKQGMVEEARSLQSYQSLPALRTVGYTELFSYFENKISLKAAIDLIRKNTRQYAKRQLTWFRKDPGVQWHKPLDKQKIIDLYQGSG
ncbi:MAG: tRNA (adenosine(37)-N6)-dimethylallyltransferase MiaA [Chitinophagaceae bacterium]|nr:tRNA (adenosine(37)-N6)-dimethylallyltransferase MiaA [Chitinophagaceae bacterium]